MSYYFYILYSKQRDSYYIGHTGDLSGRLRRHNSTHKGFTGADNDWEVVYTELYETKTDAYRREREVKSWKSRKRVKELVLKQDGQSIPP